MKEWYRMYEWFEMTFFKFCNWHILLHLSHQEWMIFKKISDWFFKKDSDCNHFNYKLKISFCYNLLNAFIVDQILKNMWFLLFKYEKIYY